MEGWYFASSDWPELMVESHNWDWPELYMEYWF